MEKNWSVDEDGSSKLMRKAKDSPFVPIGKCLILFFTGTNQILIEKSLNVYYEEMYI